MTEMTCRERFRATMNFEPVDRMPMIEWANWWDKTLDRWQGEEAMRAEFERPLPVAQQGGFCIRVDHQTPPGVSLENYRIYLRLFKEYAKKVGQ